MIPHSFISVIHPAFVEWRKKNFSSTKPLEQRGKPLKMQVVSRILEDILRVKFQGQERRVHKYTLKRGALFKEYDIVTPCDDVICIGEVKVSVGQIKCEANFKKMAAPMLPTKVKFFLVSVSPYYRRQNQNFETFDFSPAAISHKEVIYFHAEDIWNFGLSAGIISAEQSELLEEAICEIEENKIHHART